MPCTWILLSGLKWCHCKLNFPSSNGIYSTVSYCPGIRFCYTLHFAFLLPNFLWSMHSCVLERYNSQSFWYCLELPTGSATLWLQQAHKKVIKFLFTLVIGSEKHTFEYIVWNIFQSDFVLVAALSGSASLFAKRVKRMRPKGDIIAKNSRIIAVADGTSNWGGGIHRKLISFRGLPCSLACCHTEFIDDWFAPCAYLSQCRFYASIARRRHDFIIATSYV